MSNCPSSGFDNVRREAHDFIRHHVSNPFVRSQDELVIRTSERGWYAALARAYKDRVAVLVIDDALVGFNPAEDTLYNIARKAKLSAREIAGACVAIGMSVVGVGIVIAAMLDPEPTSKLTALVTGGIVLAATGGASAVWILADRKPPTVKAGAKGFEISWA